jgi:hypothetical protein
MTREITSASCGCRTADGRRSAFTDRGQATIAIVDLSRDTYLEDFTHHVTAVVMPVVADLKRELAVGLSPSFRDYWRTKCAQLLDPDRAFRALSEDVLRHEFPSFPEPPG